MSSPMQLEDYIILDLKFSSNCASDINCSGETDFRFDFNIKEREKGKDYILNVRFTFGPSKQEEEKNPYNISISLSGHFLFPGKTDKQKRDRLLLLNGTSILYGIARGLISQITANSVHGKWVIPTVNFIELIENRQKIIGRNKHKKSKKRS